MARRAQPFAVLAAIAWLGAAGCGDGSCDDGGAAPPAGGVHETSLAGDPALQVSLEHTVLLHLEAAGSHQGDTHEIEGADLIPYFFPRPFQLTLAVDDAGDGTPTVILFDDDGFEVAEVGPERSEQTVRVAGAYTIEVHHPRAGSDAEPLALFLRPEPAGRAQTIPGGGSPTDETTLRAGRDCEACNLRGMVWLLGKLTGTNLALADFSGAMIEGVELTQVNLAGAVFDGATILFSLFNNVDATRASFKRAKFQSLTLFQNLSNFPPGTLKEADFTDAMFIGSGIESTDLDGALFAGTVFDSGSVVGGSDFRGADLSRARFSGTNLKHVGATFPDVNRPALLRGARLSNGTSGVVFENVDLTEIDFTGIDLRGGALHGCTLDETTIFTQSNLSGLDFAGVDLSRVDLSQAILSETTSFAGATLSDGVAHGVNLAGHTFPKQTTEFKGANLAFTNFSGAGLEEVDLEGAILDDAVLIGANLNFANLKDATLRGARLGVQPGAGTAVTNFGNAFMVNVDLTDADLRGADLSGAHLYGTSLLLRTQLDSANLSGAICAGAAFSGTLTDTVFNNAVLVNATFNGAVLTDAKFDSAYLQGADFSAATDVSGATLRNAVVSTTEGTWMFMEQDGTPFTYRFNPTVLGAFATDATVICPNDESGPCSMDKLMPVENGPFPPQPPCVPSDQYCFENCLTPPNFDHKPPCG